MEILQALTAVVNWRGEIFMMLQQFLPPLLGGILIGFAATLLLLFQGRIFGISGIVANALFVRSDDAKWQAAVVLGLLVSGVILLQVLPDSLVIEKPFGMPRYVLSGILVGFGTQLGSGCTSGHGVCGISRLSPRSLVATFCFIAAGITIVSIMGR